MRSILHFIAAVLLLVTVPAPSVAQSQDELIKSLYGKVFIHRNEPGAAFRPQFGVTNEELHISKEGSVTAITRIVTIGTEQQRRGKIAGQAEAWARGQLTGRAFRLRAIRDPDHEGPYLRFDIAPDGLIITRGDGAVFTRQ